MHSNGNPLQQKRKEEVKKRRESTAAAASSFYCLEAGGKQPTATCNQTLAFSNGILRGFTS